MDAIASSGACEVVTAKKRDNKLVRVYYWLRSVLRGTKMPPRYAGFLNDALCSHSSESTATLRAVVNELGLGVFPSTVSYNAKIPRVRVEETINTLKAEHLVDSITDDSTGQSIVYLNFDGREFREELNAGLQPSTSSQ